MKHSQPEPISGRDRLWAWVDACALFLIALIVRGYVCGRIHHISSDEFFYTVIARDIYHIWTGRLDATVHAMDTLHPGGVPMVLAVVFLAAGKPLIAVGQHFDAVLSSLAIAATYWMVREALGNRWIALASAVLMAFLPASIRDADRVYADNQSTLLVTVAMASAFRSWRTGRILPWVGACVSIGAAFLTKEYLLFLSAPALALGSLMNIRRHRWPYIPMLLLVFLVVIGGVWFLQFKSMLLPQASYLLAELHGERQDYVGRTAPSLPKLMAQHLSESDVPYVFLALALAGIVVMLISVRRPIPVLPRGATDSNPGAVVAMIVLPMTFCVFFSMFRNLWGARLVFPSLPAVCASTALGLLASGSVPGLIALAAAGLLSAVWLSMPPGPELWRNYLIAVYSIPLLAIASHLVRMILRGRKDLARVSEAFSYAAFAVLLLALAAPGIAWMRFDLGVQAAKNDPFGPQFGMFHAADWIRRNVKPEEAVLACNPRQISYFKHGTYADLMYAPWWDSSQELTEPAVLRKFRVRWVLISQPETRPDRANWLYQYLKRRPDMREAYVLRNDKGIVLAFFRVVAE